MPDRRLANADEHPHPIERQYAIGEERWSVWEDRRPPPHGPALVFENERVARRVRNYPANWRELSDDELNAVSWGR